MILKKEIKIDSGKTQIVKIENYDVRKTSGIIAHITNQREHEVIIERICPDDFLFDVHLKNISDEDFAGIIEIEYSI